MRRINLAAAIAALVAGAAFAQGMPSSPSTSSPSTSSPSSGSTAGGSGYLTAPDTRSNSKGGDPFTKLDKNTDGMVTKAEAKKDRVLDKQFDTLDSNKDGGLDNAEFSVFESGSASHQ